MSQQKPLNENSAPSAYALKCRSDTKVGLEFYFEKLAGGSMGLADSKLFKKESLIDFCKVSVGKEPLNVKCDRLKEQMLQGRVGFERLPESEKLRVCCAVEQKVSGIWQKEQMYLRLLWEAFEDWSKTLLSASFAKTQIPVELFALKGKDVYGADVALLNLRACSTKTLAHKKFTDTSFTYKHEAVKKSADTVSVDGIDHGLTSKGVFTPTFERIWGFEDIAQIRRGLILADRGISLLKTQEPAISTLTCMNGNWDMWLDVLLKDEKI